VALDVPSADAALAIVDELSDSCRFYKIGGELFTASGPQVVRLVRETGSEVFLDLKYHDIPNTVRGAVRSAAALGVRLLTVHALGGLAMLRAAAEEAGEAGHCGVLAVTLLTSLREADAAALWGRAPSNFRGTDEVLRLADLAAEAGVLGVVCSGAEARAVKERFGGRLAVLIPGVRLSGAASQDQARVVTPAEAAATGADYVVLGRAVTAASDRKGAMREVAGQLRAGAASLA
jgi:orotidine-5'-phosphate decarboxylase